MNLKNDFIGKYYKRNKDNAFVTILTVSGIWVMARMPGCIPFVVSKGELERDYTEVNKDGTPKEGVKN